MCVEVDVQNKWFLLKRQMTNEGKKMKLKRQTKKAIDGKNLKNPFLSSLTVNQLRIQLGKLICKVTA